MRVPDVLYCPKGFVNDIYIQVVFCDVTLSVYPHRASSKNIPGHGGN